MKRSRGAESFVGQRHPCAGQRRGRIRASSRRRAERLGHHPGDQSTSATKRIVITYPDVPVDTFPVLEFNGYVLDFLTECVLFNGAWQNLELSTEPLPEDGIFT